MIYFEEQRMKGKITGNQEEKIPMVSSKSGSTRVIPASN
jgi:hypothetical protein